MEPPPAPDHPRREWLAVAALTAIGFGLRIWPAGRLGLAHFDEGIYALAASWSVQPKGLAALDPIVIPYAPPGYPILAGLACWLLGRSDGAMIAVSQASGTLTIPLVAWLARRSFGPGAGFASAAFCATSGPHIAFSRMALTDASFLLAWLLALGAGLRFLERPAWGRALLMGLAVGLAQQFKYNGWLAGGIVIGTAALGILVGPEGRKPGIILKTYGWGALAAGVAWLVVWPWYAFVEAHGGYPALLRHQRSYLGGVRDWWPNLMIQADQASVLSGGIALLASGVLLSGLTPWIARTWPPLDPGREGSRWLRWFLLGLASIFAGLMGPAPYWLGLVLVPWLAMDPRPARRLLGVWWLVLSVLTPFYHPYARLWLAYHAANWLLMGWLVANGPAACLAARSLARETTAGRRTLRLASIAAFGLLGLGSVVAVPRMMRGRTSDLPGLLAPSDSLYRATVLVASRLPDDVRGLRLLARPPVTFYLAGRIPLFPMAGSDSLRDGGDPRVWALVDSAILRSEAGGVAVGNGRNLLDRFASRWELIGEFPTMPGLPTLLDLDPGAARSPRVDRSYPLWLLRPRTAKAPR